MINASGGPTDIKLSYKYPSHQQATLVTLPIIQCAQIGLPTLCFVSLLSPTLSVAELPLSSYRPHCWSSNDLSQLLFTLISSSPAVSPSFIPLYISHSLQSPFPSLYCGVPVWLLPGQRREYFVAESLILHIALTSLCLLPSIHYVFSQAPPSTFRRDCNLFPQHVHFPPSGSAFAIARVVFRSSEQELPRCHSRHSRHPRHDYLRYWPHSCTCISRARG